MKKFSDARRNCAEAMLKLIHQIKHPTKSDIEFYLDLEDRGIDPNAFVLVTNGDNEYPDSPGDDVSKQDMEDNGYWEKERGNL